MPQNLALNKKWADYKFWTNQDCCKLSTVNRSQSALMCVCFDVLAFRAGNSNIIIIIYYLLGAK